MMVKSSTLYIHFNFGLHFMGEKPLCKFTCKKCRSSTIQTNSNTSLKATIVMLAKGFSLLSPKALNRIDVNCEQLPPPISGSNLPEEGEVCLVCEGQKKKKKTCDLGDNENCQPRTLKVKTPEVMGP